MMFSTLWIRIVITRSKKPYHYTDLPLPIKYTIVSYVPIKKSNEMELETYNTAVACNILFLPSRAVNIVSYKRYPVHIRAKMLAEKAV